MKHLLGKWLAALLIAALLTPVAMMETEDVEGASEITETTYASAEDEGSDEVTEPEPAADTQPVEAQESENPSKEAGEEESDFALRDEPEEAVVADAVEPDAVELDVVDLPVEEDETAVTFEAANENVIGFPAANDSVPGNLTGLTSGETENGFTFTLGSNNTFGITGYTGTDTVISIPSEIVIMDSGSERTLTYSGIVTDAFKENVNITSIIIPNILGSVSGIGSHAFQGCTALTSATIPNSVTGISEDAFQGCTSLTSVDISGVKNIGQRAFKECTSLESATLSNSLTKLDNCIFQSCSSLESITIPGSVESIGRAVFEGCTSLTSATIYEGVTSIGNQAFNGCINLGTVTIPDTVTSIGVEAFNGCSSLGTVAIPDGVTSLGERVFCGCSSLTGVEIPDSVESIENQAFSGCSALTSIEIPDSVTSIGNGAFSACNGLTTITVPDSVTSIGTGIFASCVNLKSAMISKGVTSTGERTFEGCKGLTHVDIAEGVTIIGQESFNECEKLDSVIIPQSVTQIDGSAFRFCYALTDITINTAKNPNGNKDISFNDGAFFGIPNNVVFHSICNSKATEWLNNNGYNPQIIHVAQVIPGVPSTCIKKGISDGSKCAYCDATDIDVFKAQEELPLAAHTPVTIPGKAATITETGLTEGKKCSVCNIILEAQKEIPRLPAPDEPSQPAPIVISALKKNSKKTLEVAPGTIARLDLGGATGKKFKSSKKKVATVDQSGQVIIKGAGKTKITFKVGKKKRTVTLKVVDPTIPKTISLAPVNTAVKKGDVITLTPTVPENTNPGGFKWKSSNKKVATVKNGVVKFKKKGKATITCTSKRGKKKAKIKFNVSK